MKVKYKQRASYIVSKYIVIYLTSKITIIFIKSVLKICCYHSKIQRKGFYGLTTEKCLSPKDAEGNSISQDPGQTAL